MAVCNIPPPTADECFQIPICDMSDMNKQGSICSNNITVSSCMAGFMYYDRNNVTAKPPRNINCLSDLPNAKKGPFAACYESSYPYTRACCPGYYCPASMYCMLPCTDSGSYCPSSDSQIYPNCGTLEENIMSPSSYASAMGCGGSKKGDTICPAGSYCRNSSDIWTCPHRYFCRQGSTQPNRCSGLMSCPIGMGTPKSNGFAMVSFVLILSLVIIFTLYRVIKTTIWRLFNTMYEVTHGEEFETWKIRNYTSGKKKIATLFTDENYKVKTKTKTYVNRREYYYEIREQQYRQGLVNSDDDIDGKLEQKVEIEHSNDKRAKQLDFLMDIEYKNLCLTLKSNGKQILHNCSGTLHCGTINAIMGPSGSGKTSFLFTLCGKASSYGKIKGDVFINGEKKRIYDFKDIVGFVPQSDAMTAEMSVKEILQFNAQFRLSSKVSKDYRSSVIRDVLHLLKIIPIRHSLIGDDIRRGISGGQQKRVNIGMELVSQPSMIFLDEPTSGLDSSTSNEVMDVLKLIAKKGTTVVVVLHQPRYEIFQQFDNIILLCDGGKIVYNGNTSKSLEYFQQFGFNKPQFMNPADFMMDIICGSIKSSTETEIDLVNNWIQTDKTKYAMRMNPKFNEKQQNNNEYKARKKLSFFRQCSMCSHRSFTILWRQKWTLASDVFMITFTGFVLGFVIDTTSINKIGSNIFFTVLSSSIVGCIVSLRIFGNDRIMYWRFASVGINKFAYYCGSTIACIPWIILQPFLFLSFYWPMSIPRAHITSYYFLLLLAMFVVQGLGHLISVCVDSNKSILVSVVLVMIFNFFNGFQPTLNDLHSTVIGTAVSDISYSRWQQEALYNKEINAWPQVFARNREAQQMLYGWQITDRQYTIDILIIVFIGVVFRCATFIALITTNKSKQS